MMCTCKFSCGGEYFHVEEEKRVYHELIHTKGIPRGRIIFLLNFIRGSSPEIGLFLISVFGVFWVPIIHVHGDKDALKKIVEKNDQNIPVGVGKVLSVD